MSVKKTNIYTFVFLILVIGFSYGLLSCGKLNEAALITDSSDTSDTSTTTPTVSSSQLTSFVGPDSVDLSWTDSVGTDRTEYMVRRSSTVIPRTIFQGDTIYSGYSKSFSDTTMSTSTSYHYSIFKRASGANWSYLVSQDYRVLALIYNLFYIILKCFSKLYHIMIRLCRNVKKIYFVFGVSFY